MTLAVANGSGMPVLLRLNYVLIVANVITSFCLLRTTLSRAGSRGAGQRLMGTGRETHLMTINRFNYVARSEFRL